MKECILTDIKLFLDFLKMFGQLGKLDETAHILRQVPSLWRSGYFHIFIAWKSKLDDAADQHKNRRSAYGDI
jgi:hypothetical protein